MKVQTAVSALGGVNCDVGALRRAVHREEMVKDPSGSRALSCSLWSKL